MFEVFEIDLLLCQLNAAVLVKYRKKWERQQQWILKLKYHGLFTLLIGCELNESLTTVKTILTDKDKFLAG